MRTKTYLEELVAEWYDFKGYFVKTNIPFGKGEQGGIKGEIDVLVYDPATQVLKHVEVETGATSYSEIAEKTSKKFERASDYYSKLFPSGVRSIEKQIITGWGDMKQENRELIKNTTGADLITIKEFFNEIKTGVQAIDPTSNAIPECYRLLRTVQMFSYYT
ncbi:MAG: hypothetical protein ACFFD4_28685 [Candidatus Odinarchaeota archaeon]